jgi:acyl-CoA dehydrogenase
MRPGADTQEARTRSTGKRMLDATATLTQHAREVADGVAGPAADAVDREARFPSEAVAAMRERGMFSALVPVSHGGAGASLGEVVTAIRVVAGSCAASALVLAMHSIEVANLVRHGTTEALQELARELAAEQLLFANANSEVGIGGDIGQARCAVEPDGGRLRLVKDALAISYGEYADVIFATARRSPEAEATDVVQAICRAPTLEPLSEWDAIGLRGTCSRSFRLVAAVDPALVYPVGYAEIAAGGALQRSQLMLSAVWVGIAEASAARAHAYVRAAARRQIGTTPRSATRLAELSVMLDQSRGLLATGVARIEQAEADGALEDASLLSLLRNLKIAASRGGVDVARAALEICGIAGYRRDTPFSLDRQLRDAHGGLVMVSNDRYLGANAEMLVVRKSL